LDFDVFDVAWVTLIQRFHNTISYKNFPGPQNPDDRGLLVVDQTEERKLRGISRRMRRYNPVPSMFGPAARQFRLPHWSRTPCTGTPSIRTSFSWRT
jgi:hypothetical protein